MQQLIPTKLEQLPISKSRYLQGIQCPKLLWHDCNAPTLIPQPDAQQQAMFAQGREVGNLAKKLFPDGIEVGHRLADVEEAVLRTEQALELRRPLFEATFATQHAYARVDILNPTGAGRWDVYEVKSSTSLKDIYLHDLALQVRVLRDSGIDLRRYFIVYINSEFVRHGEIDPQEFFVREDVTDRVDALLPSVEDNLERMHDFVRLDDSPVVQIGRHCNNPFACPLIEQCWSHLPEHHVLTLPRIGAKGFKLLEQGISGIRQVPDTIKLTPTQRIQRQVVTTGIRHIDAAAITAFLKRLKFPLSYVDFETFSTAIPLFDDASPFEQIPFQFSLHTQRAPDSEPEHRMFLADGCGDPRREFMERLHDTLADEGSVVVFNAAFEKGVLTQCAELFPEFEAWVDAVKRRMVDLLVPFRAFHFYHPSQLGSASIKAVMPALTGRGYDGLEIAEGATASLEFMRVHFSDVPSAERQRVRQQLEDYCQRDTEGMVWIVDELRKLANG